MNILTNTNAGIYLKKKNTENYVKIITFPLNHISQILVLRTIFFLSSMIKVLKIFIKYKKIYTEGNMEYASVEARPRCLEVSINDYFLCVRFVFIRTLIKFKEIVGWRLNDLLLPQ